MNNKFKMAALALILSLGFTACNQETKDAAKEEAAKVEEKAADAKDKAEEAADDAKEKIDQAADDAKEKVNEVAGDVKEATDAKLVLRRSLQAPHGEGSFATVGVITDGDKIVDVSIDELQYFNANSDFKALPNQDEDTEFKAGNAEGKILGSKVENSDAYSKLMTEKAKSTVTISDNYKAIENFAKGKTISELEEAIKDAEDGKAIDSVTGATLVDTKGYIQAIINTAQENTFITDINADSAEGLELKRIYGTAGAKNAITDTFVVVKDGKILAASIDEFQYIGENGVPNSGKKFGENFADPAKQLSSKLENNEEYSKMMKDMAKATNNLDENYKAICDFVIGKTPEEIKEVIDNNENGKPVDAVTGATLNNTVGYLEEIYKAATK